MGNRNLIRFDWAIKRLLRNKADYSILEGFLSELLKEDISIENILESESNQQLDSDKYNRVDMLVKKQDGELVIIEIQNQSEFDYFQRMMYGTSKVITEYISIGEPYSNIKKVFSINIVYFDLGQGNDYVYHGFTDFKGIHNADTLELSAKQSEMLGGKSLPSQLFPEYYVIKVNQFDDIARDTLDEWIYYFKNNEIKEEFRAKGIHKAKEQWRYDTLSEDEQNRYELHLKDLRNDATRTWNLKAEAKFKVREEREIEIAMAMILENSDFEFISKVTGLSIDVIKEIKSQM